MATATRSSVKLKGGQNRQRREGAVDDPLKNLTECERVALLIKFCAAGSKGGMCAAMSHGHSFQSTVFRLPAKCSACHELVWGPFTRGCTCLTCSVTVHRSCTGMATMPHCPTKDVFDAFCRSELGLPPKPADMVNSSAGVAVAEDATAAGSASPATANSSLDDDNSSRWTPARVTTGEVGEASASKSVAATAATEGTSTGGDLDEWAKVEETSGRVAESATEGVPSHQHRPPPSASCALKDLGSSFSWSPLDLSERKRPILEGTKEPQEKQQDEEHELTIIRGRMGNAGMKIVDGVVCDPVCSSLSGITTPEKQVTSTGVPTTTTSTDVTLSSEIFTTRNTVGNSNTIGIRGVTRLSVAGGVVGAIFGGPVGAMVGLKLGLFLGAGRSVQQGLWQRIEKNRREAGAEETGLPHGLSGAVTVVSAEGSAEEETGRKSRDVWARIAQQVEGEKKPVIWELDPKQDELLQLGECDAGEVAMFIVGKVLADETAMLFHLYEALLTEFRRRHCSIDLARGARPVAIRRRSSDTDMVALFPRSCSRSSATNNSVVGPIDDRRGNNSRSDSSKAHLGNGHFASTPGLEKTFSFVEEVEIVAGEESDTPVNGDFDGGDGDEDSGGDESSCQAHADQSDAEGDGRRSASAMSVSTSSFPAPAAAAAVKTMVGKRPAPVASSVPSDLWRSNSARMDSWVQLDDGVCSSCGGRVTSGNLQGSKSARTGARGVEEDEGGLGEGWAAAEAPLCWCRDEGGLSASPEDVQNSMLANIPAERDPRMIEQDEGVVLAAGTEEVADRCEKNDRQQPQNGRHSMDSEETASGVPDKVAGAGDGVEEPGDALRDVHGVLRELTRAVLEWCPSLTTSHEAQIQAVNCIDQRVFSETYDAVFGRITSLGMVSKGDKSLARRVRREERSRLASGRASLLSTCRSEVMSALRAAGSARTGRDKLEFFVQAVERASDALAEQPSTDALIFSVCRHLAGGTLSASVNVGGVSLPMDGGGHEARGGDGHGHPALPRPHAEVAFVEQFMRDESWVMGKQGYVLTTVIAALHVLSDSDMSDDVFLDPPAIAGSKPDVGGGPLVDIASSPHDDHAV